MTIPEGIEIPYTPETHSMAKAMMAAYEDTITQMLVRGSIFPRPYGPHRYRCFMWAPLLWTLLKRATEDDPVGRAVLELHSFGHSLSEYGPDCAGCDFSGYDAEPPSWPCRTIDLLVEHYGIVAERSPESA